MPSNLELVRSIYAAQKRGEPNPRAWAHPEIELVFADGPSPGSWTGVDRMVEGWRAYLDAWENYYSEPLEMRELDDVRVLVFDRVHGRAKASGVDLGEISPHSADVWHVRDGRVVRIVVYFDRERALADLGLTNEGEYGEASR
jgi:ketosteroid isomerase-like protein